VAGRRNRRAIVLRKEGRKEDSSESALIYKIYKIFIHLPRGGL